MYQIISRSRSGVSATVSDHWSLTEAEYVAKIMRKKYPNLTFYVVTK